MNPILTRDFEGRPITSLQVAAAPFIKPPTTLQRKAIARKYRLWLRRRGMPVEEFNDYHAAQVEGRVSSQKRWQRATDVDPDLDDLGDLTDIMQD